MLDRLLESKAKRERSAAGAVASLATHSALIGFALYATAQARFQAAPSDHIVRPVYFPAARSPAPSEPAPGSAGTIVMSRLVFVSPAVNVSLPSIEVSLPVLGSGDFHPNAIGAGGPPAGEGVSSEGTDATFRADQVERQVSLLSGSAAPTYPDVLRAAGVEGGVVARFVVSEEGRVEDGSVKVIRSDNHLFEEAVHAALARMRFAPAEIGGKKVRQLVEMPFVFTLSR